MSPDGYKFFIIPEDQPASDPIVGVALNSTNLEKSIQFWGNVLNMNLMSKSSTSAVLSYKKESVKLELKKIGNFFRIFAIFHFNEIVNLNGRFTIESRKGLWSNCLCCTIRCSAADR